ncbi:M23 family metallopeptidase [Vallitalea okinawensis]|uniref:M23 family metallopeptidase n=1 Tax=Vallitalea okinawensis TaxID=2078660 RepID=UPI000CFB1F28|nr:M23 family metallopeptidase [Vallitalea okinawensis]
MRKKSIIKSMIVIIQIVYCTTICHAQDASVLLRIYGFDTTESIEIEEQRLIKAQKEYSDVLIDMNSIKMLSVASDLYQQQYKDFVNQVDQEIEQLRLELANIQELMELNREKDVDYLLELDVKYRSIFTQLEKKLNDRELWKEHMTQNQVENDIQPVDEVQLSLVEKKLIEQRGRYEMAASYAELGDIDHLKHPLNNTYTISSPFGWRLDPITKEANEHHNAVDLVATMNTEVLSSFHGTVEKAAFDEGLGYYVIINHGQGIKTLYGHLNSYVVEEGQVVQQYEVIAFSGNSGLLSTGPHLHFGLYINGLPVDPTILLNK